MDQVIAHQPELALRVEVFEDAALAQAVGRLGDGQHLAGPGEHAAFDGLHLGAGHLVGLPGTLEGGFGLEAPLHQRDPGPLALGDRLGDRALAPIKQRQAHLHAQAGQPRRRVVFMARPHRQLRHDPGALERDLPVGSRPLLASQRDLRVAVLHPTAQREVVGLPQHAAVDVAGAELELAFQTRADQLAHADLGLADAQPGGFEASAHAGHLALGPQRVEARRLAGTHPHLDAIADLLGEDQVLLQRLLLGPQSQQLEEALAHRCHQP